MRIGIVAPTYDRYGEPSVIRRLILEAEALGYDSVWFGDHIVVPTYAVDRTDPHWYEAMTCAIAGTGMTSRIGFGTDVLVAPYRNPLLLAKMAATASELSGGRLQLGMGMGFLKGEFEAMGGPPFERRGAATDEYLRVIRRLFAAEGAVSFAGEWIRFEDIHFGPVPSVPPPLLVGGNHERAVERAARLGDGWHPLFMSPEEYSRGRARIEEIRDREGLKRPFTYSYSCAQTRLLQAGEPRPQLVRHGEAPEDYDYVPAFARAPDGRQRMIGEAAELRADVEAFAAAGVQQMVLRFAMPWDGDISPERFVDQIRAFAAQVLPDCGPL